MKLFILFFIIIISLKASPLKLRVGVLSFGTVNWELNLLKLKELDKKYNFELEIKELASKNGSAIAFASNDVDIIVGDWIWVNRQKSKGNGIYFYPYSKAVGAIYTNNKDINNIIDLKDKKLGIAGGPLDKTWLLFQAYSKNKFHIDLKSYCKPVFASPIILNKKLEDGTLDATMNFWHYNVKLEEKGMKKLISLEEILNQLNLKSNNIPFIGWIFRDEFASKNKELINSFLQASYEAKEILEKDDNAWKEIKHLMHTDNENIFTGLKSGYRKGIPKEFGQNEINDINSAYTLLSKYGGKKLIGDAKYLDSSIFWNYKPKTNR